MTWALRDLRLVAAEADVSEKTARRVLVMGQRPRQRATLHALIRALKKHGWRVAAAELEKQLIADERR